MTQDSGESAYVQSRIDPDMKERVRKKLDLMGLSQSSAIQMFFAYIDNHDELPFQPRIPNETTISAIERAKKSDTEKSYDSVDKLHQEEDLPN